MSGGHFDYQQYRLIDIADELKRLIETNGETDEDGYTREYSADVLYVMQHANELLRVSAIFTQRLDWLISGDDSEESFFTLLNKELEALENEG